MLIQRHLPNATGGRLDRTLRLDADGAQGAIVRTPAFEDAVSITREGAGL